MRITYSNKYNKNEAVHIFDASDNDGGIFNDFQNRN